MQALKNKLQGVSLSEDFQKDLPYLQHAFNESLLDLEREVRKIAGDLTEDIIEMARQLCDPDPSKRGDPKWKQSLVPNYDLQRYISRLNLLSKKAF